MVNADIKKSIIIGLIFITTIFTSYYWLQPVEETHELLSNEYSLVVYDDSQSENFKSGGAGVFLISLDKKKKSEGFFTFRGDHSLLMDFFVGEGHESEGMKFTVTHNEREVFKSLSYENNSSHFSLSVNSGDEIRVTAENDSSATRIDGNIKVAVNEPYAEVISYIIPFIFSVLSIFLLGKGYIYLSINGYLIFTLIIFAEKSGFGGLNVGGVLAYTCLIFVMIFSFVYLHQELHFIKKIKAFHVLGNLIAAAIYVCPLLFVVYVLNFDAEVTKDTLRAVFQTNNSEMSEYISSYISPFYILFFVFIAALVGFLLYWQERKEKKVIDRSFLMFMTFVFSGLAVLESSNLRLFHFVYDTYTEYRSEVDVFFEARRKGSLEEFGAFKEGEGETFVFIIGESLNKNHMGLYGYFRETTPILSAENDKGEIIKFNTAYSNHSHTTPALSLSLTEGNQYSKSSSHSSLSIVEVLRKAEIETHWITNQTLGGPWGNNKVSIIASSVDNLVPFNTFAGQQIKSENYDEVLVDELKNILAKKSNKNRVIFIHLLGNHSGYALRYPNDRFSKFAGALSQGVFGLKASNKYINPYDNSVLYNDFVVGSILKEIQKETGVNSLLYVSDHAEDVIGYLGHNSGKFTYDMVQVPMLAWFSDSYKKEYSNVYSNLSNNSNALYSTDMLYDTIIGILDIKTDRYDDKYDFSSKSYELKESDALVLHGKRQYIEKSNYIYWQKNNSKYLVDTKQSSRIFPHRVNSIGKLNDIWNAGFRSFEVDVKFGEDGSNTFQVGHNNGVMGINFEEFLSHVDSSDIERIWLDFKNLNADNHKAALSRLTQLHEKFNLKRKLIVESGATDIFFKEFSERDWHTSYYLPTGRILKMLKEGNDRPLKELALKVSQQVTYQNLGAVSFDNRVYPFVKKYLEANISSDIVYHVWYSPGMADPDFKSKLLKQDLYNNERVKTLLSVYKSRFNL